MRKLGTRGAGVLCLVFILGICNFALAADYAIDDFYVTNTQGGSNRITQATPGDTVYFVGSVSNPSTNTVFGVSYKIAADANDIYNSTFSLPSGVTDHIPNSASYTISASIPQGTVIAFVFSVRDWMTGYWETKSYSLQVGTTPTPSSSGTSYEEEPTPRHNQTATVVNVREYANIRTLPSTDATIVGQVALGEIIELVEWDETDTWCKIIYNGGSNLGWLHGKFIK